MSAKEGRGTGDKGRGRDVSRIPALEWVVAAIGLLFVLGALGTFVYEARRGDGAPPAIEVRVDSITRVGALHHVAVTIRNRGDAPAASVTIEGALSGADSTERSSVTIDYLPERSERTAGVFFTGAPAANGPTFRVMGYVTP